ncbi:MAG: glycosyltransferase family 2 protein [Oscillospiraceae bacterium]|nr:glycosyltransferase family 2 protein [Oscillospiraceae bacterium]
MSQEYLISIVTPSYNTQDDLFRAAFDSVAAQPLDESKIEWVIVVHNSTKDHLAFVQSLCEGHPGFRVFELNNDRHTASSPRNYALTKVTGRYVTFLDADDRLTPECLETIVKGMDETGAQVGKFRSEKFEEDSSIMGFLDNRVRFDQTKPLICLHRDDPDVRKLMTMANMMMCCQVVERSFLEKFDVHFSEDVRIYEDVVFNMECLSYADTIAVFPQLIGYVYYMHHGSTMQELRAPTPEEILETCRDIAYQIDFGLICGLYMRYLFFGHMKQLADMVEASEKEYDFPDDIRHEIREMIMPFFTLIEPPDPDRKFLSREKIDEIMSFSSRTLLGLEEGDVRKNRGDTAEVLIDILRSAEETEIGENWGFDRIRSHQAYREQRSI